ncbi:hemolysin XhlA family protein [Oenococcus oeni]|uniref:hemolysin XhlA family protein n=3 Tax=Oenococcus oeni TaxID=1247 RepID=UPI0004ABF0B2|nr:hemolysin XhlA family protein [Oenococcus oeni]KEP86518.1 holin [Oenococcus oeni IOEB_0205]KGH66165.1 hypothetical protein X290_08315 [Oenococcus oeni IOEB_B16]
MSEDINTTQMLIEMKEDIATIKQKVEDQSSTDEKAEKALAKSVENEHEIARIGTEQNWLIGILITAIIIPIGTYIIYKFL